MRSSPPSINIARLTYLLVCQAAGFTISLSTSGTDHEISIVAGMLGGLGVAGFFVWIESLVRGFSLRGFSNATFGLAVGLLCAWLLTRVQVSDLLELAMRDRIDRSADMAEFVQVLKLALDVALFASLGFLGVALALRGNRDDFAFIIPYVRFRRDATGGVPCVIDTSVVMDGRMIPIMQSGFLEGRLILPSFVLDELNTKAAGGAGPEQEAAQRSLNILEEINKSKDIEVSVHDAQAISPGESDQARLIELSRILNARLLTNDEVLAKLARLQNQEVLNIQDLELALKPAVIIGQRIRVPLVRIGKDDGQAVGYLSDGTMIVVNQGASKIGETVEAVVTSTLETGSGLMVFAQLLAKKN
ncbi:MAG: PIN/TRAM domain-containing protein [Luteolibacter sp.]